MGKYITDIQVSLNDAEEADLQSQGFSKIDVNLHSECCPQREVYIWYRKLPDVAGITRMQVSFTDGMSENLTNAGFIKVDKNLGGNVFLWYLVGKTKYDIPIISLSVSTNADDEALKMKLGMERVGHNLSRGGKGWRYLWMEREMPTYIHDVTATNFFGSALTRYLNGWICIDETTNTLLKGSTTFLWYCHTTDAKEAITDLKISHKSSDLVMQGYTCVDVNLNEDSAGKNVFVWFKKESGRPPVKSMLLLVNHDAIHRFQSAGINVIKTNINDGNDGYQRCLCFINQQ